MEPVGQQLGTPLFQSWVLRMVCDDPAFAAVVTPHLKPAYFDFPVEAWAYHRVAEYNAKYKMPPPMAALIEYAHHIPDPAERANTLSHLVGLANQPMARPDWSGFVMDGVFRFLRAQFLRESMAQCANLHDVQGQPEAAVEYMVGRMRELERITRQSGDRSLFFEELDGRILARKRSEAEGRSRVPTGFSVLDKILGGGLPRGELGTWLGYAKTGKSTLLTNLGASACRAAFKVLHLVYEGRIQMVESKYDAIFSEYPYSHVKRGEIPPEVLDRLREEYRRMQGNLVVKAFTKIEDNVWNCSVQTILDELTLQRATRGWVPDLIIIDYADLLQSRDKSLRTTVERQVSVYQELHSLAESDQGYSIWTAAQPQRPGEDAEEKAHLIRGRNIADCYGKIRVCDFYGSLNMTLTEREAKVCRLFAEGYRDGPADQEWLVQCDLDTMTIREKPGLVGPHAAACSTPTSNGLGYKPQQVAGF